MSERQVKFAASQSCALLLSLTGIATTQVPRPAPAPQPPVFLRLPAQPSGLLEALVQVGIQARTAMGLEVVMSDRFPATQEDQAGDLALKLSGVSVSEALERCVKRFPTYSWSLEDGVYQFRPRRFVNNREVSLNRVISSAKIDAVGPRDALYAIQRLLDPKFGLRKYPLPEPPQRLKGVFDKPITLNLDRTSVRHALDDLARQHGSGLWSAEYSSGSGSHLGLKLTFHGFDKWSTSVSALPLKVK